MVAEAGAPPALPGPRPPSRPHPGRWRRIALTLLAVAALAGPPAVRYLWPREVARATVLRGPLVLEVAGPGTLEAVTAADLATRIAGRLVAVRVERNDRVAAGQVLAEVASADLSAGLAQARAAEEAAVRSVAAAEAALRQAEISRDKLDDDLARSAALVARGVVGQSDHAAKLAAQRQAEAGVAQLQAALEVAQAQAASAAASVASARALLAEATIRAPFAGIVVERMKSAGDFVAAGVPVLRLVDPAGLVLTARFDESLIATLHAGQPAELRFSAEPGRAIPGRVLRLSRSVDGETREFTADVVPDALPENWALGQRGSATVRVGAQAGVLTLPAAFLIRRNGRTGVWLDRGGRARWQPVETGAHSGGRVEIVAGLAAGEVAITGETVFAGMRLAAGAGA